MTRKIRRRKRVSHSSHTRKVESVRPDLNLPQAKPVSSTRVLIAAPGPKRTILAARISASEQVQLAGVAENESAAVEKVLTEDADVAAIYIHLGGELAGLDIARNVMEARPEAGILILVDNLAGVDVRRHSRRFGVAWSYTTSENVETGTRFCELVQSVSRGFQWIDPELKRVMEAIWKVADQGRDLEASSVAEKMSSYMGGGSQAPSSSPSGVKSMRTGNSGVGNSGFGVSSPSGADTGSAPRGVQTMRAGNSGVGNSGFGVGSAGQDHPEDDESDDDSPPRPGGIQTMQTGRGGIGSDGFGVSKAG